MTEAEWLTCSDPVPMLRSLHDEATEGKLRLFACACCRRVWNIFASDDERKAVEIAELYVDGLRSIGDLLHIHDVLDGQLKTQNSPAYYAASTHDYAECADTAIFDVYQHVLSLHGQAAA